jgi:hypothetical protein
MDRSMTALADVMAGPPEAAAHRISGTVTPAAVERAAVAAGWRFALVESVDASDKAQVMAAFQAGLGWPDWFGRNLDALVDALRDVGAASLDATGDDAAERPGTVVMWDRPDLFEGGHADDYTAVLDILAQRAGDPDRPRLIVLVRPSPTEA